MSRRTRKDKEWTKKKSEEKETELQKVNFVFITFNL